MMLNKLSDKGMVVYEEIIETKRSRYAFYKFLNTIKQAMKEMGIEDPNKHIIVYSWDFWGNWKQFQTVLIKTPFTPQELGTFSAYHSALVSRYGSEIFVHPNMTTGHMFEKIFKSPEPLYSMNDYPDSLFKNELYGDILEKITSPDDKKFVESLYVFNPTYGRYYLRKKSMSESDFQKFEALLRSIDYPYELDLSPTTDDKPFPFNIYKNKKEVKTPLEFIFKIAAIMLIPVLLLAIFKYGSQRFRLLGHTLFALLGFGFMLIEIVLMQNIRDS